MPSEVSRAARGWGQADLRNLAGGAGGADSAVPGGTGAGAGRGCLPWSRPDAPRAPWPPPVARSRRPHVSAIPIEYGADDPLVIEPGAGAILHDCRGPRGVTGDDAERAIAAALCGADHGPPLAAHVVAGDRVVVAIAGAVPQATAAEAAVRQVLAGAGLDPGQVTVLRAGPLAVDDAAACAAAATGSPGAAVADRFDPAAETATSYLAADAAGQPLYVSRELVDADVVLAIGAWNWNAALGGRGVEGELWPTFSRLATRRAFVRSLARRGRRALPSWRDDVRDVTWQLGVGASLRLVPAAAGALHAACFGTPADAEHRARAAAEGWRPRLDAPADLAIVSLSDPRAGFDAVTRAVAAAARVTRPGGSICIAGRFTVGPGIVFLRWRQGAPLVPLLREAVGSGDPCLVADALATRLFARALGERRVVLLSDLDESTVEELGFGHAASPEVVERLAHRAERVVVLHEGDQMLPRVATPVAGPVQRAG
jgi:hypothetical protein